VVPGFKGPRISQEIKKRQADKPGDPKVMLRQARIVQGWIFDIVTGLAGIDLAG